ncbi:Bug family tripartite tricarboxylate transporter substrate binding protein [Desertibacillus haloalkaliphilus]|uniref:Bug family tripartite tricarboxylate transporter substrate binding protein n=1 Tax=Desertibacillus haloalkaliphilus TaxID=1328930 RepID=UPI001C26BAF9|nr:hypothetical protein [Desertibacillus haloalkaliphilus]MBU8905998.1 hypothetical protein [Desertibacillus haloalkaliphilus]
MLKKSYLFIVVLLLSVVAMVACSSNEDASSENGSSDEVFYDGKTLEILVPTSPGGGSDIMARFMTPYLHEHIEGNPTVQAVNVPGGGTITGSNEFALMREANGENAIWASISTTTAYLLNNPAIQFDYADWTPVVGYPDGGVVYISPDTGVTGVSDLLEADEQLVYGGTSATGLPLTTILSFEVLGLDVDAIFGYESSGPARIAFEQGETNIDFQTTSSYFSSVLPLVEEGKAIPLYAMGQINADGELVRDPHYPELPTVKEVYEELHGEEPSGEEWDAFKAFVGALYTVQKILWVHDEVPEESLEALINGAENMVADEEFITEGADVFGYDPFVGEELQTLIKQLHDLPDGVQDWVIDYLETEHDVQL